jgi:hypothetical protein
MPPSYNVIEIDADEVRIVMRQPGQGKQGEEPLAHFARRPVTTSEFYPPLERFVRYSAVPLSDARQPAGAASAPPPPTPSLEATSPVREAGPTIIALLEGGPLAGRRLEAEIVEGRPPTTIDVEAGDGGMCRYCLGEWAQAGPSAVYTFLYRV